MVTATISAGLIIAIVVSLLKPFIEARIGQTSALHDGVIRITAVVIGVVGEVAHTAVSSTLTAQSAWNAAGDGLLAAVTAIATFHLVTSNYFALENSVATVLPAASGAHLSPGEIAPAPDPIFPAAS